MHSSKAHDSLLNHVEVILVFRLAFDKGNIISFVLSPF